MKKNCKNCWKDRQTEWVFTFKAVTKLRLLSNIFLCRKILFCILVLVLVLVRVKNHNSCPKWKDQVGQGGGETHWCLHSLIHPFHINNNENEKRKKILERDIFLFTYGSAQLQTSPLYTHVFGSSETEMENKAIWVLSLSLSLSLSVFVL